MSFFFQGLLIGLAIAAPVGPIGVLCIKRSLTDGRLVGFVTGLGAATADAAYGCVAAFGLTALSSFMVGQRVWLGFVGGLFLCFLGVRTFLATPRDAVVAPTGDQIASAYFSALVLTMTNPMTIMSFIWVFAGLGLGMTPEYATASMLVAGVFTGSALWWLLLSGGIGLLRDRVNVGFMRVVNRCSAGIIFGFGVYALAKSLSSGSR